MLTLTHRFAPDPAIAAELALNLTAEERTRSRYCIETPAGPLYLRLPRGTVLRHNDLLRSEGPAETWVRVIAKPEPVMVVTASTPLALLRAAYHLGNRHVPLEVAPDYLRFAADPVLKTMLAQFDVAVTESLLPFQPEAGAYSHHAEPRRAADVDPSHPATSHHHSEHSHSHSHSHHAERHPDHAH